MVHRNSTNPPSTGQVGGVKTTMDQGAMTWNDTNLYADGQKMLFLLHFQIETTWGLHSHFAWLKLSYSLTPILLEACLAAHSWGSLDGLPQASNCYCLPGTAVKISPHP